MREYEKVQAYLFETSDRLNTSYNTLADSYSKILTLQDAGVVTQEQGIAILEGMANAAAKTGAYATRPKLVWYDTRHDCGCVTC